MQSRRLNWVLMIVLAGNLIPPVFAADHGVSAPLLDLGAEAKKAEHKQGASAQPAPKTVHTAPQPAPSHTPPPTAAHQPVEPHHAVHWSYSGEGAPRYWGDLDPKYHLCKDGMNQSPIDLRDGAAVGTNGLPELDVHYRSTDLKIVNNGHTIQVNYPLGSYIKIGGHRYELLQFHFHTPSEHKKEGFNYPMEVHLVHKDGDGRLAVIGVIFEEGEHNDFLQNVIEHFPKEINKEDFYRGVEMNPVKFFPSNKKFYKYSGSLTTPPCSEGVYWMVFKHPIQASVEQIQAMNEMMGDNARPVQPLNSRSTLKSWAEMQQQPQFYEFY